jgi:predicted nucleic acid-binding protein
VSLVLDSSATLAWIYQDEVSDVTQQIFELVANSRAWVPAIWRLEVANGLQTGVRRGRIDAAYRDLALGDLALLDISIDQDTDKYAWSSTLRLADRFRLTLYDAAYLELAQRRSLPLASLDEELRAAARGLDVLLIGVST